jgi:hypothetical protein
MHNRVVLNECPIRLKPAQNLFDTSSPDFQDDSEAASQALNDLTEMDVHGSDQRLKTFFNASYINSLVKSTQQKGPSFIASSSP